MTTHSKEYQGKIEKLKELIGIELDLCDSYKTPVVCANASNPETRENIVNVILDLCITGKISVDEAIDTYERTFNPNMAD